MSIPKITHQIWMQGWDNIPSKFKANVALLEDKNPEFNHRKWDEESLRVECARFSPAARDKFDSFKYLVQKVDFGRYVVLYNYGGVSVDTDMVSLKPINNTPKFSEANFIISSAAFPANIIGWLNNALIMSKKGHPILLELIQSIIDTKVNERDFTSKELYIDATTSPSKFNSIVYRHINDVVVLNYEYFEPCFSVDPICRPGAKTIMDHQHELSWFHGKAKILAQVLILLVYFLLFICLPLLLIWFIYFIARPTRKHRRY
jgi:mannosyltransferase OCH1-like enzyme